MTVTVINRLNETYTRLKAEGRCPDCFGSGQAIISCNPCDLLPEVGECTACDATGLLPRPEETRLTVDVRPAGRLLRHRWTVRDGGQVVRTGRCLTGAGARWQADFQLHDARISMRLKLAAR